MERYRLKNIIILILVLVNVFLLSSLVYRKSEESAALRRTEEELVELFASSGITLEDRAISWETPTPPLLLSRSEALERQAAEFLLGSGLHVSSQGGTNTYAASQGSVQFRSNGSFEATGDLCTESPEDFCRKFCSKFSYSDLSFRLDSDTQYTGSAVFHHESKPVYNCTVTFTILDGTLVHVSGTLLPQEGISAERESLLSAAAALTTFQQMRLEEGTVGSSILATELCYELESTAASTLTLESAWCIATDISKYYVNCSTGEITVE